MRMNFSNTIAGLMLTSIVTVGSMTPAMAQSALAADLAECQRAVKCIDDAFERSFQRAEYLLAEIDEDLLEARGDLTPLFAFTDALAEGLGQ